MQAHARVTPSAPATFGRCSWWRGAPEATGCAERVREDQRRLTRGVAVGCRAEGAGDAATSAAAAAAAGALAPGARPPGAPPGAPQPRFAQQQPMRQPSPAPHQGDVLPSQPSKGMCQAVKAVLTVLAPMGASGMACSPTEWAARGCWRRPAAQQQDELPCSGADAADVAAAAAAAGQAAGAASATAAAAAAAAPQRRWVVCLFLPSIVLGPHCPSTTQRLAWLLSVISIAALQQAVLACICLPILLALTETGEPVGVG